MSGRGIHIRTRFLLSHSIEIRVENAPIMIKDGHEYERTQPSTYELGSHNLHVGEVVDVLMSKDCIADGKLDPKRIDPIIYSGYNYYRLGEVVGKAYSSGKGYKK